jgi:outer membrane protein TolC
MQSQSPQDAPRSRRRVPSFARRAGGALLAAAAVAAPAIAQPSLSVPRSGDTLLVSLPDAVARVLAVGDETRIAEAQEDATNGQVVAARATAMPQLRFNGNYTQQIENARAAIVSNVFGQRYTYNGNVNLSLPIFQGGRAVGGIQAARRTQASSRFAVVETRAQATVDVQRAYLEALAAEQLVAIQDRNLALSSERVTQAEQLERAGRAARYDVLRVRVERTNLEPLAIQARNDRELAYLDLKRLLNLPLDAPLRLTTGVPTDSSAVLAMLARVGGDTVMGERGLLRSAEEIAGARSAAVKVARADYLPTISVFWQSGYLALPTSPAFPTRFGRASNDLCPPGSPATRICQNNGFFADRTAGLQVTWNVFDGLRTKGNVDLAQANARVAELQLAQTRERVSVEVAAARAQARRVTALYQSQRANVAQAEEAFRLAQLRATRGLGTQLEVSDAQLALLTAQTNALRATFDVYLAAAELDRSLGRPIPLVGQTQ